jgi:hypothetical protein
MFDNLIPLAEVADRLPTRPGVSTVHRWAADGLRGGRVKLKTLLLGGKRLTTEEWLHDFVKALNGGDCPRPDAAETPNTTSI